MTTLREFINEKTEDNFSVLREILSDSSVAYSVTNGASNSGWVVTELQDDCFIIDCYSKDNAYDLLKELIRCACQ